MEACGDGEEVVVALVAVEGSVVGVDEDEVWCPVADGVGGDGGVDAAGEEADEFHVVSADR